MANLLYVTPELIKKLHKHPAYQFWSPILEIFPIRPVPLDERIFHPRPLKVKDGEFYLTTDMKFVYCTDKLLSFLYESQDLSFRLTAKDGILHTVDGKQFTSILGKVGEIASSSDVKLVNTDKVFHPFFDSNNSLSVKTQPIPDDPVKPPAILRAPKTKKELDLEKELDCFHDEENSDSDLLLGKYERPFCEDMVNFRNSSKKSYNYLGEKYNLPVDDVKAIVMYFKKLEQAKGNNCDKSELDKVPKKIQDEIVRMKKVSKKSYKYLSERFNLSVDLIRDICTPHLKRPRRK